MEWLNYHHLLYFWVVAKEGSVTRASERLNLSQPAISGQISALERSLGEKLFIRQGRKLVLTPMGQTVQAYADEIFSLGRELIETVRGRPTGQPLRLVVGVADVLPKLVAYELLAPAFHLAEPLQLICREDSHDQLLAELALHRVDVVLSDMPLNPGSNVRAFNHLLGECGVSVFGTSALTAAHQTDFPRCLDGAPMLVPLSGTSLRRSLDAWFEEQGIRLNAVGQFEDSALLKVCGQKGLGLFCAPSVIEAQMQSQYGVQLLGRIDAIRERFYVISLERKLKHPATIAMSQVARHQLFQ